MLARFAVAITGTLFIAMSSSTWAASPIRLVNAPALSPDGSVVAFAWRGDIWTVPAGGGTAQRLTTHEADDGEPEYSPDGTRIAFVSNRTGSRQIYVMPAAGGDATQLTFHTAGYSLEQWYPDGNSLLTRGLRDHYWRRGERFLTIDSKEPRSGERLMFDAYGNDAAIAPDGQSVLFTREGTTWWRKNYQGSQASQIWQYTIRPRKFRQIVTHPTGCRSPLWSPDGTHFYYVSGQSGAFNLWKRHLESGEEQQLTQFPDDSVVFPAISRDGNVIVFRHLFDLYALRLQDGTPPQKMDITYAGDDAREDTVRRALDRATEVAFSHDGLEVAFIAGGDVWVMDTELREPKQVTNTAEEERDLAFSPDTSTLLYVSDAGQQCDIWSATRANPDAYWWRNESFTLKQLTNDSDVEQNLEWSPQGELVAFVKSRGDLWVMKPDGSDSKRVVASWNAPDYDWSPDGKWLVYAISDNDFNREVFLWPLDGSREPFNLSMHPRNDGSPVWSPDGSLIAFTGQRRGEEVDIHYVYLQAEKEDESTRDRTLKKALEKMEKSRKKEPATKGDEPAKGGEPQPPQEPAEPKQDEPPAEPAPAAGEQKEQPATEELKPEEGKQQTKPVQIDFEGIHDRIRTISIPESQEDALFWSHDSKKLAFIATVDGTRGTYTVEFPDELKPKLLVRETNSHATWISTGNQILWLSNGVPASFDASANKATSYAFQALQTVDVAVRFETAFLQCWRLMRDHFYDERLNNKNWDAIYRKYATAAREAVDLEALGQIVNLMLGELNASHLGFRAHPTSAGSNDKTWQETTAHLGLRFDPRHKGPGLKVRDVILDGVADRVQSKILPGEIVLSVDGQDVDPALDLTRVLNGSAQRDIALRVKNEAGEVRDVTLRPMSYDEARGRLYEMWVRHNRELVDQGSEGRFGYLHIRGMDMPSFHRFEQELYEVGFGKDGLMIDVRENGGGFTTDHLLTALTQPDHAVTVPRAGGQGYPHDRRVYATWNKPIVVLCNQNSFSNAEIFSHAIKTLRRGRLVGVPTSGSVISTGAAQVMDIGTLRMPFRGWFLPQDGADMELRGAVPHVTVWPQPGELPAGKDRQLQKAIAVLKADVKKWQQRQPVTPRTAAEQRAAEE